MVRRMSNSLNSSLMLLADNKTSVESHSPPLTAQGEVADSVLFRPTTSAGSML